jgi:ribonuclease BN (tRNA processing enzyme)
MDQRPYAPDSLADKYIEDASRLLVAGAPGTGKSTLAARLVEAASDADSPIDIIDADPGTPSVGPPGAIALVRHRGSDREIRRLEGLATLDAGRYRLPVAAAVARTASGLGRHPVIIDAPGLHRGLPAAELLPSLVDVAEVDTVLLLTYSGEPPEVATALTAAGAEVVCLPSPEAASSVSLNRKARQRTEQWETYLEGGESLTFAVSVVTLAGDPPPLDALDAWPGRQVAALDEVGRTIALGEVEALTGGRLTIQSPPLDRRDVDALVVRNARRDAEGRLRTDSTGHAEHPAVASPAAPPLDDGPLSLRAGQFRASLLGGLFDDPTVYVDSLGGSRAFLLDLGAVERCTDKMLDRVSDIFVSHAHTDHFNGFARVIRHLVHSSTTTRVFGPAGIADRVEAMVDAFTWKRWHADEGPVFEVTEYADRRRRRFRIRPGGPQREFLEEEAAPDGVVHREERFAVRARELDHGTASIAYAIEERETLHVRSDRLGEGRYQPGPWLGELKRMYRAGELDAPLDLPDGRREEIEELADELLYVEPGASIVYATDFRDIPDNRQQVLELAEGADLFFCESCYAREHADKATQYAHLTTDTCAGLARDADVGHLVPMHFSQRYRTQSEHLYAEILETFSRVAIPAAVARRMD